MSQSKTPWIKILFVFFILAGLGVGAWIVTFPKDEGPQFITSQVARKDLEETVLASGTLEAEKLVSVGAQASGQIKSMKVQLGDRVTKGQLIAEIDSLTQQNTLKNAEAALDNMRAQMASKEAVLKQTDAAYERQKKMQAKDAVSKESFQTAEANYETAKADVAALKAQITQAEITVDTAKVNLGYTQISAPMDGTIVAVIAEEGQTVNSVQDAPTIVKLARLDTMTIKAKISEADITRVAVGQKVYFTIMGEPDHKYYATLRAIEPAPDSISDSTSSSSSSSTSSSSSSSSSTAIYYNGLFDAPNLDGKLRISMTAEIHIVLGEAKHALSIPRTALGDTAQDGSVTVMVMDPLTHRPVPRRIKIGLNNNVDVQVMDGLSEGEQVIVGQASASEVASSTNNAHRPPPMGF